MATDDTKVIPLISRRARIRYAWRLDSGGKVFVTVNQRPLAVDWIDLSRLGFGIKVAEVIEPGTMLSVQVLREDESNTCQLQGEVVHCSALDEGCWRCGCKLLVALTQQELNQVLDRPRRS